MAKIKVNLEALKGNSTQLADRIRELQGLNTRLETLINRIEASWEGQASATYITQMRRYADQAKKMIGVLTEYKKYVDGAVEAFTNRDRTAASRIRGSF